MIPKIFVVNFHFITAGDMFTHGLAYAAEQLGVRLRHATWSDETFAEQVEAFNPDLLLVINGRHFVQEWGETFSRYRTAVWLVDEPYEVDDTAEYARQFDHVFIQDPSTLDHHKNAHYLPVCYDPSRHYDDYQDRIYRCGFVGYYSWYRKKALRALLKAELIDYIVGGPWTTPAGLASLCVAEHLPPAEVADYYRKTRIAVNIWRRSDKFNKKGIVPHSMNPRVYEALACGALVLTEDRPEVREIFPDLPTFGTFKEMTKQIRDLLADEEHCAGLLFNCAGRLHGHTYEDRLRTVLKVCLGWEGNAINAPAR